MLVTGSSSVVLSGAVWEVGAALSMTRTHSVFSSEYSKECTAGLMCIYTVNTYVDAFLVGLWSFLVTNGTDLVY